MSQNEKDNGNGQAGDELDFLLGDLPEPDVNSSISIPADDLAMLGGGKVDEPGDLGLDLHPDALEQEMTREFATGPEASTGGGVSTGLIVGIGFAFLILVGCFAWFAMSILSPSQQEAQGMAGLPEVGSAEQVVDDVHLDDSMMGFNSAPGEPLQGGAATQVTPATVAPVEVPAAAPLVVDNTLSRAPGQDAEEDPLVVHYSQAEATEKNITLNQGILPQEGSEVVSTPGSSSVVKPTEEELMYDKALESISALDIPEEAVKIDESVIRRKLDGQKVQRLEQELTQARSDVGSIKTVVSQLQGQLSQLNSVVSDSTNKQDAISKQIESLTEVVKQTNARQEQEILDLKNTIKSIDTRSSAAADTAQKALERAEAMKATPAQALQAAPVASKQPSVASVEKITEQPKLAPVSPAPQQPQHKPVYQAPPKPAVIPKPVQVAAAVQPPVRNSIYPEHCTGSGATVSQNWRVKGVNNTSAYIVRVDGEGVYVKKDSPVSEFGTVIGFDPSPSERTVCTTRGLIRR